MKGFNATCTKPVANPFALRKKHGTTLQDWGIDKVSLGTDKKSKGRVLHRHDHVPLPRRLPAPLGTSLYDMGWDSNYPMGMNNFTLGTFKRLTPFTLSDSNRACDIVDTMLASVKTHFGSRWL